MLRLGLDRWKAGLASWTVVTDFADDETAELARGAGLRLHRTNVFYEHGAAFNKGAALEEARRLMPWADWILFIDADIIPPQDWKGALGDLRLAQGVLYGCWRLDARSPADIDNYALPRIPDDRVGYGYFQLFHSACRQQDAPLLDTFWQHAGNYDSTFLLSFAHQQALPMKVWHIGGASHNWFGRGQSAKFAAMERERARLGGGWASLRHERIPGQ